MDGSEKIFFTELGSRLDRWGVKVSSARKIGISKATMTRWINHETKPNLFKIFQLACLWKLSPAHLAFGTGPETINEWNNFARLSSKLRDQPEPVQQTVFRALDLPYDPPPAVQPIRFTAAAVAKRLQSASPASPRVGEDPAFYHRTLDPKTMQRMCDIVTKYLATRKLEVSCQEADDLAFVLSVLQTIVEDPQMPQAHRNHADAPNAEDATANAEAPDKDEDPDDHSAC